MLNGPPIEHSTSNIQHSTFASQRWPSRRQIVPFQYPVEDAVDELRRLVVPELLGDLDGLVDHDELRRAALVQKFVDRHPDDVAIDDGHTREAPVVSLGLDHAVDVGDVIDRAAEDL